jgi:glycosyltransferase involved in cell wall biosynthesis
VKTAVLINNFNHAAWLPACLESVFAQTHPADEIIVYDDASTDDSLAILRRYEPRITVIAGPRLPEAARIHQGTAIHEGFRRSTADVIFLLDSDDVFTPGKIARYLPAFSQSPRPVLVQAPMHWIDSQGRKLARYPEAFKHTDSALAATYAAQDPDLFFPTSALAFTREFLNTALPIDWSDDINLWSDTRLCLAALLAGPIVTLREECGGWRHHRASDSARQARAHTYQLRQTIRRTKVFNRLATNAGLPPISLWRNRRFYLQLVRLLLPSPAFFLYQKLVLKTPRVAAAPVP